MNRRHALDTPADSHTPKRAGFTLIELSIVLVIIGLIIGGILVAQDLIEAAQQRGVIRELTDLQIKITTFRGRYGFMPGDAPNASNWDANCGGVCNGNGNGRVGDTNSVETDTYCAWHQLAASGLLTSDYPCRGVIGPGHMVTSQSIGGGYYQIIFRTVDTQPADSLYSNKLIFGGWQSPITPNHLAGGVISPRMAQSIDQKIDDGRSLTGRLKGMNGAVDGAWNGDCHLFGSTLQEYDLSKTTKSCVLWYLLD